MRQYTTPTLPLTVEGVDLTDCDYVWVTLSDKAGAVVTKENPEMTLDGEDTEIEITLTQAETGQFAANQRVDVEVNWMKSGVRGATEIAQIMVEENLLKEILPNG